jgi:hypothetical protein
MERSDVDAAATLLFTSDAHQLGLQPDGSDGTDWTQQQPAQSPDARSFAGMAAAGGLVVLFGGGSFGGSFAAPVGTWTWDGARWTQQTGPGPAPRNYPAMAAR